MLARCLARALAGFAGRPRQQAAVSACFFFIALLPSLLAAMLGGAIGVAAGLVWAWCWSPALMFACNLLRDSRPSWLAPSLRQAWRMAPESFMSASALLLLLLAARLAGRFYFGHVEGLLGWALAGAVGTVALWAALAVMMSLPLGTEGASWKARWKAACLAPLAYFPACLACLAVLAYLSGIPALFLGLRHRGASLLFWPATLMPIFTPAFGALFLLALLEEFRAHSLGQPPPAAPSFKELWQPWR